MNNLKIISLYSADFKNSIDNNFQIIFLRNNAG